MDCKVICSGTSEVVVFEPYRRTAVHICHAFFQSKDGIIRGKPRDMCFGLQSLSDADEPVKQGTYRTDIRPHPILILQL